MASLPIKDQFRGFLPQNVQEMTINSTEASALVQTAQSVSSIVKQALQEGRNLSQDFIDAPKDARYAIPVSTCNGTEIAWRAIAPKQKWRPPSSYKTRLGEEERSRDINDVHSLVQLRSESRAASPVHMRKARPLRKPLSPWKRADLHTNILSGLKKTII